MNFEPLEHPDDVHRRFEFRRNEIDYERIGSLCYLGCYRRRLPVNLNRMIENAYDWEHLPFVHQSSFDAIKLIDEGDWGWRAVATLRSSCVQHLELLVDKEQSYWATTVLSGDAKGFEIHSRAEEVAADEIEVVIRFYWPQAFTKVLALLNVAKAILPFKLYRRLARTFGVRGVSAELAPKDSILNTLSRQYAVLYDEDEVLMIGRQAAINRLKKHKQASAPNELSLGLVNDVRKQLPKLVRFGKHRYVVNLWNDQWVVYAADCPHLLGPLQDSLIDSNGRITCPWHGYQFDVVSGNNCSNSVAGLPRPPQLSIVEGRLVLSPNA